MTETPTQKTVSLYEENGNKRNPLDVLKEVQAELEEPMEEGTVLDLDEDADIEELLKDIPDLEEKKQMLLWGVGTTDTPGNIEICPMKEDTITLHGAEEIWFFICRLLDCSRTNNQNDQNQKPGVS